MRTAMDFRPAAGHATHTAFSSRVQVEGNLTEREKRILLNSARQCDVHKILEGSVAVSDQLVVNGEVWEPDPPPQQLWDDQPES